MFNDSFTDPSSLHCIDQAQMNVEQTQTEIFDNNISLGYSQSGKEGTMESARWVPQKHNTSQ